MNQNKSVGLCALLSVSGMLLCGSQIQAATYSGNGNSGFGGPIGFGSLTLGDDGATINGTINKGPNGLNDALVIYIQSGAGGFSDTSGFADGADGLRKAISGFDGGGNRSVMSFASGFKPNYALALGPSDDTFGGLWQLANGGNGSLNFVSSANLSPTGTASAPTYSFSITLASIGLPTSSGASFELFGTYTSDSGFRSDEAVAGVEAGTQGWHPFSETSFSTYTTVPEPSSLALLGLGVAGAWAFRRRKF